MAFDIPQPARAAETSSHEMRDVEETTCCIVGGGPAGAVLALLLVRQGIPVTLLEQHADFDRDFRGDTLHPSILEVMDEIGLAERLLSLPHAKVRTASVPSASGPAPLVDFSGLKTRFPFIYGFILVFRIDTPNGDTEYRATSDQMMTMDERTVMARQVWAIETYHRGVKQYCGIERCAVRSARAQRNHIGWAIRAFCGWNTIASPLVRVGLRPSWRSFARRFSSS